LRAVMKTRNLLILHGRRDRPKRIKRIQIPDTVHLAYTERRTKSELCRTPHTNGIDR
jgi:hypothetical protein